MSIPPFLSLPGGPLFHLYPWYSHPHGAQVPQALLNCIRIHEIVHFKCGQLNGCQLYVNKAGEVFLKRRSTCCNYRFIRDSNKKKKEKKTGRVKAGKLKVSQLGQPSSAPTARPRPAPHAHAMILSQDPVGHEPTGTPNAPAPHFSCCLRYQRWKGIPAPLEAITGVQGNADPHPAPLLLSGPDVEPSLTSPL